MNFEFQCEFAQSNTFRLQVDWSCESAAIGLTGPSGSGKTTVLNLIAGHLLPMRGRICIGQNMLVDTQSGIRIPPEKRQVGYVMQDTMLFPHLNVQANLLYGWKRSARHDLDFQEIVDLLQLGKLLQRQPTTLSGGEKQRVAIGRAILRSPRILLLDEPMSAIDAEHQKEVSLSLKTILLARNIVLIAVSHDAKWLGSFVETTLTMPLQTFPALDP